MVKHTYIFSPVSFCVGLLFFLGGCTQPSESLQQVELEGPVDTSLSFKSPAVDFLSARGQAVQISAQTATVSSGVIRFDGDVAITPVGVQNLRLITSQRGVILSEASDQFFGLNAARQHLDAGSRLELEGDVVAQLISGKVGAERLSFDPQTRSLWSQDSAFYRGPMGYIKSSQGFYFDAAKDTLRLEGESSGEFAE